MFGFLFGKKKKDDEPAKPVHGEAPGTHIAYSPELVSELKDDHQELLKLFGAISAAHARGDLEETCELLDRFRSALGEHLIKENVRFYIYLEHALKKDQSSYELVHQFRREMDDIGKAVMAFLKRYRNLASDPALAKSFGADLGEIGKVLGERIRSEETTLYSLYLPAY